MYKKRLLGSLCFFLVVGTAISPVDASSLQKEKVIITFKGEIDYKTLKEHNIKINEEFENIPSVSAEIPKYLATTLSADSSILSIDKDVLVTLNAEMVDEGMKKVQAPQAWNSNYTGKKVKIGIIDTGVDFDHEDLSIKGGVALVSELDGYKGYNDYHGHGTHVAGIIGAKHNNIGVKGVAPDAELYAIKAFDASGLAYASTVIEAVDWAIEQDMDILNMSIGFQEPVAPLEDILKTAEKKGMILVAAAGNDGEKTPTENTIDYPGRYASTITVGAIDNNNKRADFNDKGDQGVGVESRSSTGAEIDVVAPGYAVASTFVDNQYAYMSGTSMAAPYVTGLLAALKEAYPNATAKELRKILTDNAVDLGTTGKDIEYGYGLAQFVTSNTNDNVDKENKLEVSSLKETHTNVAVALSWKNPGDDFKQTKVYRNGKVVETTSTESYKDKSLKPNTSYTYKVTTIDKAGNESTGVTLNVKTNATVSEPLKDPKQIKIVKTSSTDTTISISYTKAEGDKNITDALFAMEDGSEITTDVDDTTPTLTFQSLKPNTTYRFNITSINETNEGEFYSKPLTLELKTTASSNQDSPNNNTPKEPSKETPKDTSQNNNSTTKPPFTDVKEKSWAYEDIRFVYNQKWMGGVDKNTTFKPTKSLTRAEAATIFVRALGLKTKTTINKATFKDVSTKHWAYTEIEIAKQHGIFSGTDKNNFSPEKPITRREMAAVFNRIVNDKSSVNTSKSPFKDVTKKDWAQLDILAMADKKILSGYPDGTFKPANAISREEMAALMKRSEPFFKK